MKWQDIDGWFYPDDEKFVRETCEALHGGLIVEIGVYKGRSTAIMAQVAKKNGCEYFAVDNFKGAADPEGADTKAQRQASTRPEFEENMRALGLHDIITIMEMDSAEASTMFPDETVDFCFIDADHAPQAVKMDIVSWWPKVKPMGELGGHDYPGRPRPVVDAFAEDNGLNLCTRGMCWLVQKPGVTP